VWYRFVTSGKKELEQRFGKNTYEIIKDIAPSVQNVAAHFVHAILKKDPKLITRQLIPIEQIHSTFNTAFKLLERKQISLSYQDSKIILKTKEQQYEFEPTDQGFLKFVEKIDFIHTLLFPSSTEEQKFSEQKLNIPEGQITVIKANNVSDAILLGNGTTWCISQPKNTMYQSYRHTKASTFYFVFDTTRPEGDPLRRVVVDMNKYGVSLTDLNNNTGHISEFGGNHDAYFKYLENNGVDLNQFKNKPYTVQEMDEYEFLSEPKYGIEDFINLYHQASNKNIKNPYSKYIGFGHVLQPVQFEWLHKMNAQKLIDQYISTGNPVFVRDLPLLKPQQQRTYYRARDMVYDHYKKEATDNYGFSVQEFISNSPNEQLMDMYFFEKMINDPDADKLDLFSELSQYHLEQNLGKEQILKIMNSKEIQGGKKFALFQRVLYFENPEIVDAVINQYPEMTEYIKDELQEINSWQWNRIFMGYLFQKINEPSLFIQYSMDQLLDQNYYDSVLRSLIDQGYANQIMNKLLTYSFDVTEAIKFLLDNGASLDNAWKQVKSNYYIHVKNGMYIYRLVVKDNPNALEEWDKEKEERKLLLEKQKQDSSQSTEQSTDENIIESFNLNKYLRKIGRKS